MSTFNTIDVETANADRSSICQIGIVHVRNGEIIDKWQTLVNPGVWFDHFNTKIHGIKDQDVMDSPIMPEIRDELRQRLRGSYLVSHTNFDQIAFERAMNKYNLEQLQVKWVDSAKIARQVWPKLFDKKYKLNHIAESLGFNFKHHDALEDARVCADIVLRALSESGSDISDWHEAPERRARRPGYQAYVKAQQEYSSRETDESRGKQILFNDRIPSLKGNPGGFLFGENILFTGGFTKPRSRVAKMSADAGCNVVKSVTKNLTMLVVGVQDIKVLRGHKKSSKHRKCEELNAMGREIAILSEDDLWEILADSHGLSTFQEIHRRIIREVS